MTRRLAHLRSWFPSEHYDSDGEPLRYDVCDCCAHTEFCALSCQCCGRCQPTTVKYKGIGYYCIDCMRVCEADYSVACAPSMYALEALTWRRPILHQVMALDADMAGRVPAGPHSFTFYPGATFVPPATTVIVTAL